MRRPFPVSIILPTAEMPKSIPTITVIQILIILALALYCILHFPVKPCNPTKRPSDIRVLLGQNLLAKTRWCPNDISWSPLLEAQFCGPIRKESEPKKMGLWASCTAWLDSGELMYQTDPDIAGIGVSLKLTSPAPQIVRPFRVMEAHI